jgi:hypothetical protein
MKEFIPEILLYKIWKGPCKNSVFINFRKIW